MRKNSYFDNSKPIDYKNWTVTLAKARGAEHAQLILEGIDDEKAYFCQIAHFVGPCTSRVGSRYGSYLFWSKGGEIKPFKKVQPERLAIADSRTWVVKKDKAQMLVNHVNAQTSRRPFNIFGSYYNRPGSFAELSLIGKEYLLVLPDFLLSISAEMLTGLLMYNFLRFAGASNTASTAFTIATLGLKCVFYKVALEGDWWIYKALFATKEHPTPFIGLLKPLDEKSLDDLTNATPKAEIPHNCITWAAEQLETIDIYVDTGWVALTSNALASARP